MKRQPTPAPQKRAPVPPQDTDDVIYIGQTTVPVATTTTTTTTTSLDSLEAILQRMERSLSDTSAPTSSLFLNKRPLATWKDLNICETLVPTKTLKDDCAICLDHMTNYSIVTKLPCGHVFHNSCITQWLTEQSRTCPICRSEVDSSKAKSLPKSNSKSKSTSLPKQDLVASSSSVKSRKRTRSATSSTGLEMVAKRRRKTM